MSIRKLQFFYLFFNSPSVEANLEYLEVVVLHFEDDTEKKIEIRDESACINKC